MTLTRISSPEYDVELALAYATADNITGKPIYRHAACWLHSDAAAALTRAILLAGELDLKFRIFDAYRPVEAQWNLWNHDPNPIFLTDPRSGSPHSRGVAIDLTLVRRTDGVSQLSNTCREYSAQSIFIAGIDGQCRVGPLFKRMVALSALQSAHISALVG